MQKKSFSISDRSVSVTNEPSTNSSDELASELTGNWRNIIYFPFNNIWQASLMISIFVSFVFNYYLLMFWDRRIVLGIWSIGEYSIELFYFVDTLLHILHRNMPVYRKRKTFKPRNMASLLFDCLSLIPFFETYCLLVNSSHNKIPEKNVSYCKILHVLRVYRIHIYFEEKRKNAIEHDVFMVTFSHLVLSIIIALFVSALWYGMACFHCENVLNWSNTIEDFPVDFDSPLPWLIISFTHIKNRYAHNAPGMIYGVSTNERVLELVIVVFGCATHLMALNGYLTISYVNNLSKQFIYNKKLELINFLVRDWKINPVLSNQINNYYKIIWAHKKGFLNITPLFYELPLCLQKEAAVDIFFDAFRHSDIFRNEELAFKRALSINMTTISLLPGDYLYKFDELKTKMCYILTGIVQILSDEDNESPVISFSGGTLLGEINTLMPTKCLANVKCATYCEMHVLTFTDLNRAFLEYPPKRNSVYRHMKKRLKFAKYMKDFKEAEYSKMSVKVPDDSIKWLKHRWRLLSELQFSTASSLANTLESETDIKHCSNYLHLLVLSKDVELKMQAICLTSKFPYIFEPDSGFRKAWDLFSIANVLIQAILYPYLAVFRRSVVFKLKQVCLVLDIISSIDLSIILVTAIKQKHILISKPLEIMVERFKSITFVLDIIATIPFDYIGHIFSMEERLIVVLKLFRLIKIYKPFLFIQEKQNIITFNTGLLRMLKYFLFYCVSLYWMTCVSYVSVCYNETCLKYSWFMGRSANYNMNHSKSEEHFLSFLASLTYTVSIYLSNGISRRSQMLLFDIFWTFIMVQVGYYLFSFIVSELSAYYVLTVQERMLHAQYIESTAHFIRYLAKMSSRLQDSVVKYIEFQYLYFQGKDSDAYEMISNLPANIRKEVFSDRIKNVLKQSPLFQVDDEHFMDCVVQLATVRILPPGAIIVAANSKTTLLHMCIRGYCRMYSFVTGDKQRGAVKDFGVGYLFPLLETIHDIWALVTIETITTVELITIPMSSFFSLCKAFHDIDNCIKTTIEWHYHKHQSLLLRTGGRLPEMYALEREPLGDYFQYKLVEEEKFTLKKNFLEYIKQFDELGRWSGIHYVLYSQTIRPTSKCFIIWEIIRCVLIIAQIVLTIFSYSVLHAYRYIKILILLLKMIGLIDVYVRLHLQFYNENGLLVTHTLYTAKHYLRHSFIVDLMGTFPTNELNLPMIIPGKYEKIAEVLAEMIGLIQYYRIQRGLTYIQNLMSWKMNRKIKTINCLILSLLSLGYVTNLVFFLYCKLPDDDNKQVKCDKSWIQEAHLSQNATPFAIFLQIYYVMVLALAGATNGAFTSITYNDYKILSSIFIFFYIIRLFIIPKLISSGIIINETQMTYRENVIAFKKFTKNELISEKVIENTIGYYLHAWKNMMGSSMEQLARKLHPQLHRDLAYYVFGDILRAVHFFDNAEESFFQILSVHMNQMYIKKDTDIIRTNDINGLIYIVDKGIAEVFIASKKVATLKRGGLFGNLSSNQQLRQRILVKSKIHTTCLVLKNEIFMSIIKDYPAILKRMNTALVLQYEYMESDAYFHTANNEYFDTGSAYSETFLEKLVHLLNDAIINESSVYMWWIVFVNVHLSGLFSIWQFSMIIIYKDIWMRPKLAIRYTIDFIYLIKVLVAMHTCYVDSESGILVLNANSIRLRYCRKYLYFDLLVNLPIELIIKYTIKHQDFAEYLALNRVGRFGYMYLFTRFSKMKEAMSTKINWIYFLYCFLMFLQIITCSWWLIACSDHQCTEAISTDDNFSIYILETDFKRSQILAYSYVINIISMSSVRTVQPRTLAEIGVSIAITLLGLYITAILTSAFASATMTNNYNLNNFVQSVLDMLGHLKDRELSPALQKKISTYLIGLWDEQRGEWMPRMVKKAPLSIKQDVMMPIYGKVLENHFLFAKTHTDFLRQLVCHLERVVFFPGYFIVEKGDVDGSMYFVHSGEISQIEIMGNNEIPQRIISKGMCFGEASGLFNIPHKQSFKAITTVDLIQLKLSNWQYLLEFFPASKEEIFFRAEENGIKKPTCIRDANTYF